jgi:plastocyanin
MKKAAALLVLVLASVALAACGSSSDSSSSTSSAETTAESSAGAGGGESSGGSETIDFEAASSGLAYTSDTATAKAGEATIAFENPQSIAHDVAIEDSSGKTIAQTELVTQGPDSTTVDLKPGTYHFYCTVPGHREAGMEGTLTVK